MKDVIGMTVYGLFAVVMILAVSYIAGSYACSTAYSYYGTTSYNILAGCMVTTKTGTRIPARAIRER